MIVSFSGHRPDKLGGYKTPNKTYNKVCEQLELVLKQLKPEKAISGMCVGVDQWAAQICIDLKIPFIAAVPFVNQECKWPESSQKTYKQLLSRADEIVIVSEGPYAAYKMQIRNQWMVNKCDTLIAVFNGGLGGTYNCVQFAIRQNKKIIRIDPTKLRKLENAR